MSAGCTFIPPFMIFHRKNMNQQLMRDAPASTVGVCHPSSWIQINIFVQWYDHFIEITKPFEISPVRYSNTRNLGIILKARENVTIIYLPPHTIHELQPLDKIFIGVLKSLL